MNINQIQESIQIISQFEAGNFMVESRGESYNLTVEKQQNNKVLKFFARNLRTGEVVSGNFYLLRGEYRFRPCEISVERAHDF